LPVCQKMIMFSRCVILLVLALLALPAQAAEAERPFKLGLWPYHSAHHLLTYYEGLREHLESRLKQPVQMETAPSMEVFVERMSRGEYDFTIGAPHVSRLMQADYGWQPVARYLPDNTVYLVTRKQGGVKSLRALKGKSIATPNRVMLLTLATEKYLRTQGLAEGVIEWHETGGLASSVFAVTSGQVDAAVTTLSSLALTPQAEADQLRILESTGKIPQLFVMAAPHVSRASVITAAAACQSYQRDEHRILGRLTDADLRKLDDYAAQARNLLAGHLASGTVATRRE
jgi:ABC-type phosphate/phosphonate transport system substrate-binding protein